MGENEFRTHVSFRIMGESLDPTAITAAMGIDPSSSHKRGEPHVHSSGRKLSDHGSGQWCIKSPLPKLASLNDHLAELLPKLIERKGAIEKLRRDGYAMDIFIGVISPTGTAGFELSGRNLSLLGQLGVPIGFDVYALGD